jgi:hypothetical protein
MTKKAQYAAAARGTLLPKRGFAMQTDTIYSDDFTLPNADDIKIAVNGYTVLDSDKGEYTLQSKEKCGTPSQTQLDVYIYIYIYI